jgi:hypothetical protein
MPGAEPQPHVANSLSFLLALDEATRNAPSVAVLDAAGLRAIAVRAGLIEQMGLDPIASWTSDQ